MKKIWLDMDGTIANLYAVDNWLEKLRAYDPSPYAEAEVMVNMSSLARILNRLRKTGYKICVISALSKESTPEYDEAVIEAKFNWLMKHLPSVEFEQIMFVPYAFDKSQVNSGDDILIDDEPRHLEAWGDTAINAFNILEALKALR